MLKKLVCLLSFCIAILSNDAFAAPSVRVLGKSKAASNETQTAVASAPKKQTNTRVAKVAKTPSSRQNTAKTNLTNSSRLPSIGLVKQKTTNTNQNNSSGTSSPKPDTGGSTGGDYTATLQRLDALEEKTEKAITDIVENESGTYVSDVAVDGNSLVVTKTSLLNAPVRDKQGNDLESTAEIWIIK